MAEPIDWPFSDMMLGAWLAIGIGFCLYNFFVGLVLRQRWLSAIIIPGALFLLLEFAYFGRIPPSLLFGLEKSVFLGYLSCLIVPPTIIATASFTRKFLKLRHSLPKIDTALQTIGYLSLVPVIGLPFLPLTWVSMATFVMICFGAIVTTYAHWNIWRVGGLNMRLIGGSWLLMGPALIAWFGRNLGVFEGTPIVISIYLIGFAGNLILLSVASVVQLRVLTERVITSLKAARKLEHQLRDEITERTRILDAEKARADNEYENKRTFVSLVSHDLRGPLANASQALERLLERNNEPVESGRQRLLERVHETIQRQVSLVDRLLDLETLSRASTKNRAFRVDFKKITEERIKEWQVNADEKRISLAAEVLSDQPLYGDATLISTLLDHLLANALRHTPLGSQIIVQQHPEEGNCFAVSNAHPALNDEHRARIKAAVLDTKPVEAIAPQTGLNRESFDLGSGRSIGLQLARALITAQGGHLDYAIHDHWVSFIIRLPEPRFEVLLVDDQRVQLEELRERILAIDDSCEINTVLSVPDALEQISQRMPALVISDIRMPKKDGFDLLRAIRQNSQWEEIRVALISAADNDEQGVQLANQAMRVGADAYFNKPIPQAELEALIRSLGPTHQA